MTEYKVITLTNPDDQSTKDFRVFQTESPARLEEETFDEYKIRRLLNKKAEKFNRKPKVVWNSRLLGTLNEENLVKLARSIQKFNDKTNKNEAGN